MSLFMGNGFNVLPLCFVLILLKHDMNGWNIFPDGQQQQQQQHDDS